MDAKMARTITRGSQQKTREKQAIYTDRMRKKIGDYIMSNYEKKIKKCAKKTYKVVIYSYGKYQCKHGVDTDDIMDLVISDLTPYFNDKHFRIQKECSCEYSFWRFVCGCPLEKSHFVLTW